MFGLLPTSCGQKNNNGPNFKRGPLVLPRGEKAGPTSRKMFFCRDAGLTPIIDTTVGQFLYNSGRPSVSVFIETPLHESYSQGSGVARLYKSKSDPRYS